MGSLSESLSCGRKGTDGGSGVVGGGSWCDEEDADLGVGIVAIGTG